VGAREDAPQEPVVELDARYGEPDAGPTPWAAWVATAEAAPLWWLATVRAEGGPHVTPLIAVWHDGLLHFTTGPHEQKAANLRAQPRCTMTTGTNALHGGTDLVLEGEAVVVRDEDRLRALAAAWVAKYGEEWRFEVRDGAFFQDEGGAADVYAIRPARAYAFGKAPYSHTRYRWA
jgi:hypothetical protein